VDFEALAAVEPDLIVTQDLCHVCAATPDDLSAALAHLARQPRIVTLNPHSLAEVCADIRTIGEATGRSAPAESVVTKFAGDVAEAERSVSGWPRPRVICLEWLDPPYVAGHWVPEMVERAGGINALGKAGEPSFRVDWERVIAANPEVIVIMPCGYSLEKAEMEYREMKRPAGWKDVPAVRDNRVFIVDASGYFSRPGPRLAQGVGILADVIHSGRPGRSFSIADGASFTRVNIV
jgi:iron complex transport system substrate-binding protein